MKKSIFTIILLISVLFAFSQKSAINTGPVFNISQSSENETILNISFGAYDFLRVETPRGSALIPDLSESSSMFISGAPDVPCVSASIIIPDQGGFSAEVNYGDYEVIDDIDIAPSKGSLLRTVDPSSVPYTYGAVYSENAFFPGTDYSALGEPFILRDFRGITVRAYPFQYNPVTRQLRVYKNITIRLIKDINVVSTNELIRTKAIGNIDGDFSQLYNDLFINYHNNPLRYNPLNEGAPGNILILCKSTFLPDMQSYVTWKTEKGYHVDLVDVATAGTTAAAIKTYVQNYFNTNGLTYLLLVGDAQHIPPMVASTGDSDNSYAYILGSDGYADFFVGRFSGETSANILTQVQRTIQYERDLNESATWLGNAFGSASNEGQGQGHDGGESDATHMNNVRTDLVNYGYNVTIVNQDGGSNALIATAFNGGIGLANYIGHGDVDQWVNTTFTNTNVNQLTNENKLPFIFSVACVNGAFSGQTCFAEAWLRATKNNNPTGALAFLGSTINQSWTEPMTGQDEMDDVLVESYENNIKRSFAGIAYTGLFIMIEEGGSGQSMADTWNVFGDPSVMVRTKTPQTMTVSHDEVFTVGNSVFDVNCNTEGALVALSTIQGTTTVLLGYAYVTGGVAQINITPFSAPGTMKVTVTAYNKVTYQNDVMIIVPDGPYVVWSGFEIDDSDANNNQQADYNESFLLNAELNNVGAEVAENVNAVISSESVSVVIADGSENFGNIAVDATLTMPGAYAIEVIDGVADGTVVPFDVLITDDAENSWNSSFNITLNAPKLHISFVEVDDSEYGNNNGLLDPGETAAISFNLSNIGHSQCVAGETVLEVTGDAVCESNTLPVSAFAVSGNGVYSFLITVDADASGGTAVVCGVTYTAGAYNTSLSTSIPIGVQVEDWENGNLTSYDWENDAEHPWFITETAPYEGDNCLQSGDLTEDGGESSLIIILDVLTADDVSFYKKVSCEPVSWSTYWDYLAFYVDDVMKGQWAGTVAWAAHTYPVTAGEHELRWTYAKDNYQTTGSDCAWIDFITLPPHNQSVAVEHITKDISMFSVDMFPNPANDMVNLVVNLPEAAVLNIDIFNLNGQLIKSVVNNLQLEEGNANVSLNVSNLSSGLYFVAIQCGSETKFVKLSVVR